MKQTSPAEPQFMDEQHDVGVPLPAFVTRTTLQSILRANGVNTLTELGTRTAVPATAGPMLLDAHKPE
jgi:hypothetical protein